MKTKTTLCLLVLLSFTLLFSCQLTVKANPSQPFERLRLYWQERTHYNPCQTLDETGVAAFKLAYRGLFCLDDNELLRLDLAENAAWSVDRLALTISLRKDVCFSNQAQFTARDVAYSLFAYRQALFAAEGIAQDNDLANFITQEDSSVRPPAQVEADVEAEDIANAIQPSYWQSLDCDPKGLKAWASIAQICLSSDTELTIILKERADQLPWFLDKPIVPAENALTTSLNAVPGIGLYRFTLNADTPILLPQAAAAKALPLELCAFANTELAFAAFQAQKIDILLLGPEHYESLAKRQDLRHLPQQTLRYSFFVVGSDVSRPLNDPLLRHTFRAWCAAKQADFLLSAVNLVPLHRRDFRQNSLPDQSYYAEAKSAESKFANHTLVVAALDGNWERNLISNLLRQLEDICAEIRVQFLTPAEYADFAALGQYDLLLAEQFFSYPLDLQAFVNSAATLCPHLDVALPRYTEADSLGRDFWFRWDIDERQILQQSFLADGLYYTYQLETLPLIGAGFRNNGLLFSKRISGEISSPSYDPYRGIEVLRLW